MPKESKPRATKGAAKGAKGKKDPNAPKKPLSAYMFFSKVSQLSPLYRMSSCRGNQPPEARLLLCRHAEKHSKHGLTWFATRLSYRTRVKRSRARTQTSPSVCYCFDSDDLSPLALCPLLTPFCCSTGQIGKLLGAKWASLGDEEKSVGHQGPNSIGQVSASSDFVSQSASSLTTRWLPRTRRDVCACLRGARQDPC